MAGSGPGERVGWLVLGTEQGSRLVRTVPGEPGTALLSTRALGMLTQPGAFPPTSTRSCQGDGGKRRGAGSEAGTRAELGSPLPGVYTQTGASAVFIIPKAPAGHRHQSGRGEGERPDGRMCWCWWCSSGALAGVTLTVRLAGTQPAARRWQPKGPRQTPGWHLSREAERGGHRTGVGKSLVWRQEKATSLPMPCGRCSGLAAPGISV